MYRMHSVNPVGQFRPVCPGFGSTFSALATSLIGVILAIWSIAINHLGYAIVSTFVVIGQQIHECPNTLLRRPETTEALLYLRIVWQPGLSCYTDARTKKSTGAIRARA
ncbi:hypothetical protein ABLA76_16545 [Xenorhabdus sp. SGI240]